MKHTSKSKRVIFPTDFHPFDYHLLKRSPMLCLSTQPGRVRDVRTQMRFNKKVVLDFTLLLSSNFLGAYILLEIHVVPLQVVTISCTLIQKPQTFNSSIRDMFQRRYMSLAIHFHPLQVLTTSCTKIRKVLDNYIVDL